MLPVMAPWNKISEVIDYVREVKPQRAYDIHDALLTDLARPIYDRQIGVARRRGAPAADPGGDGGPATWLSCQCRPVGCEACASRPGT